MAPVGKLSVEVVTASVTKKDSKLWEKALTASVKGARRGGLTGGPGQRTVPGLSCWPRRSAPLRAEASRVRLARAVELRDGNEVQKVRRGATREGWRVRGKWAHEFSPLPTPSRPHAHARCSRA